MKFLRMLLNAQFKLTDGADFELNLILFRQIYEKKNPCLRVILEERKGTSSVELDFSKFRKIVGG